MSEESPTDPLMVEAAIQDACSILGGPELASQFHAQEIAAASFWNSGIIRREGQDYVIDEAQRDRLIEKSRKGDRDAKRALLGAAGYFLRHIWRPGDPLAASAAEVLVGHTARSGRPLDADRINRICATVIILQERGFPPTRNPAAHGAEDEPHSACSIIVAAYARLGETPEEASIEQVWRRYKPKGEHKT